MQLLKYSSLMGTWIDCALLIKTSVFRHIDRFLNEAKCSMISSIFFRTTVIGEAMSAVIGV